MDDPQDTITQLLHEEHGIARAKLHPSARLCCDLGIDGDDAADLFNRLHDRFGTDFSALYVQWTEFFNNEGMSRRSALMAAGLFIPSTALTLWLGYWLKLSNTIGGIMAVAVFFALLAALSWLLPKQPKRPVTIAGLAEVVQNGTWPTDPSSVG